MDYRGAKNWEAIFFLINLYSLLLSTTVLNDSYSFWHLNLDLCETALYLILHTVKMLHTIVHVYRNVFAAIYIICVMCSRKVITIIISVALKYLFS